MNSQLLAEAIRAGNAGDWAQAIEKLRLLLDQDPYNSEAHFYLAAAYSELGDWETVKTVVNEGLGFIRDDDPWKGRLLYLLGDALVMLEEDNEAISVLKQSLSYAGLDPKLDSARISMKLGLLQRGRGHEMREDTYRDPRYQHMRRSRIAQPQIEIERKSKLRTFLEGLSRRGDEKRQVALIDCRRYIKAPIDLEQALPVAARVVWDKFQRRIEETILMPEVTPQRFGSDTESVIGQVLSYIDQTGAQALSPEGYDALRRRDLCILWTAENDGARWFLIVLLEK